MNGGAGDLSVAYTAAAIHATGFAMHQRFVVIFAALLLPYCASAVVTPLTGVKALSVGTDFSCAVSQSGDVYCWGKNDVGQLGTSTPAISDGGYYTALNPVRLPGITGVTAIASGVAHSCALRSDGSVWCWGRNSLGQAGVSDFADQLVPVKVSGLPPVAAVVAGGTASCAVTNGAEVWCWGDFSYLSGKLVSGRQEALRAIPARVDGLPAVATLALNADNACAVAVSGRVYCWGYSGYGQIGDNNVSSYPAVPQAVLGLNDATAIAVQYDSACAIRASGGLACWGSVPLINTTGGTVTSSPVPIAVDAGHAFSSIAWVGTGYCGLAPTGVAYCWGAQPPYFGAGQSANPYEVRTGTMSPSLLQPIQKIASGRNHACALTEDRALSCWGSSYGGGIGRFLFAGSDTPLPVLLTGKYGAISAWIDADYREPTPAGIAQLPVLAREDEVVVGIAFDSNSLPESAAPSGTVDVLDGNTVVCPRLALLPRNRQFESPALPGTPSYYTAKCVLNVAGRALGAIRLSARFSGDLNFSSSSTTTNLVELVDGPARFRRVVEFRHTGLDYYFVTSRPAEIALLDNLAAQGWTRTGQSFRVYAGQSPAAQAQRLSVRRFYFDQVARGGTRGSHFYATAQADVDALHALNPQNRNLPKLPFDEGIDSYAYGPPYPGYTCGFYGWELTVFRFFRTTSDDPNHRYVTDPSIVASMSPQTWQNERVAFCALP